MIDQSQQERHQVIPAPEKSQTQAQISIVNKIQIHCYLLCSLPVLFPASCPVPPSGRSYDLLICSSMRDISYCWINLFSLSSYFWVLLSGSGLFFAYVHLLLPIIRTSLYFITCASQNFISPETESRFTERHSRNRQRNLPGCFRHETFLPLSFKMSLWHWDYVNFSS